MSYNPPSILAAELPAVCALLDELTNMPVARCIPTVSNKMKEADHERNRQIVHAGRSQAVPLPKEFRFEGTEVRVSKVGDKVILKPLEKQPFDVQAWFARLDELGGRDFLPDGIPDDPPAEPDPRVFFDE